jgi:predicted RNase H-like HicB family nuclease
MIGSRRDCDRSNHLFTYWRENVESNEYQVNILWSNEDNCHLVELLEFTTEIQPYFTHSNTYEDALHNTQEVLELLIESYQAEGSPLPQPQTLQTT